MSPMIVKNAGYDVPRALIAEFGADAIDIGPGTLSAGHNGVSGGLGQGARDDITDGRRDNVDNGGGFAPERFALGTMTL